MCWVIHPQIQNHCTTDRKRPLIDEPSFTQGITSQKHKEISNFRYPQNQFSTVKKRLSIDKDSNISKKQQEITNHRKPQSQNPTGRMRPLVDEEGFTDNIVYSELLN